MAAVESLRALAAFTPGLVARLQPLLDDVDPRVHARAAAALLKIGPSSCAESLLRSTAVLSEVEERVYALEALGDWGDNVRD